MNIPERIADARELVLALHKVCLLTANYEGAVKLHRVAGHLYAWMWDKAMSRKDLNYEAI